MAQIQPDYARQGIIGQLHYNHTAMRRTDSDLIRFDKWSKEILDQWIRKLLF